MIFSRKDAKTQRRTLRDLVFSLRFIVFFFCLVFVEVNPILGTEKIPELNTNQCANDLESLTSLLLDDLPSYANRVIQRSNSKYSQFETIPTYLLVAGKPEFQLLPLSVNQSLFSDDDSVKQVFFTTLERQYLSDNKFVEVQNYHWLFLTKTNQGWYLVMLLSQSGNLNDTKPPSPPRDTTNGIVGQAVKLWLRDCRSSK
jgi:hypothetical protein